MGRIRIGVAGWDYPDWNGVVYPAGSAGDRLAWIARFVDVVEINSTFYRPVSPKTAASWVQRTASIPGFTFTAKAHRSWTHERDRPRISEVLEGLAPLREADRLLAVLLQFPHSFHAGPEAMDTVSRLADRAAGWPLVMEVRHGSWRTGGHWQELKRLGLGWCAVDQPRVDESVLEPIRRVTSPIGYLRLHGRNRVDWFRPGAGRDARYDYLYPEEEIRSLARTAAGLAGFAEEVAVIQNNHFRGQALANALQMKHRLTGEHPPAPSSLVTAYPALSEICRSVPTGLF